MLLKSHFSVTFALLSLTIIHHVRSEFNIPLPKIPKLETRARVNVSQPCGNNLECTQFDSTSCKDVGVCEDGVECTGRSNSPPMELPLENWTPAENAEGCVILDGPPDPKLQLLFDDSDAKTLTVNGSAEGLAQCYIQRNFSTNSIFTLTFWLRAECRNCSILEMVQEGKPSLHLRVVGNNICLNSACDTGGFVKSNSWSLVSVRVIETQLRIIAGETVLDFQEPAMDSVAIKNLKIGSGEIVPINDIFHLTSVHYYRGALTGREITDLKSGLTSPINNPECRCPIDFLDLVQTDNSLCTNGTDTFPRYNNVAVLYEPDVMVDDDPLTNWTSSREGAVFLTLDLGLSYQLESIEVVFVSPVPYMASLALIYEGVEVRNQEFLCNSMQKVCRFQTATLDSSSSVNDVKSQLADQLRIVLHRQDSSDVGSFIVSSIKAMGWCNCYGNAQTCTVGTDSYTCECDNSTNTEGSSCRQCTANNFRMAYQFDCPRSCDCEVSGVSSISDQCQELGGLCKCKDNVQGTRCDTCKSNTYNLSASNIRGCSDCPCYEPGSVLCNNVTGACVCKANTKLPNCDECKENNYGLDSAEGCQPCSCVAAGTINFEKSCNSINGQCNCKLNVEGRTCDQCKPGFFKLETANAQGCQDCDCHKVGMEHGTCDRETGQCPCRGGVVTDKKCKPEIISVDPSYGPMTGGTLVTINGKLLGNDTHDVSVFLDDVKQELVSVNDDAIVFRSLPQTVSSQSKSAVKISWQEVSSPISSNTSFTILNNPQIDVSKAQNVTTFVSGGCSVKVYGTNLGSVKYPKLRVVNLNNPAKTSFGDCRPVMNYILCRTPNLEDLYTSSTDSFEMTAVFDGVTANIGNIEVHPDPTINNMGNIEFQYPFEDTITIRGKNLKSACLTDQYSVLVGSVHCSIEHVTNTEIECKPSKSPPNDIEVNRLRVKIGYFEKDVGTMEYLALYETTGFIIIVSCIAAAILIVIGIIVICCCCRYRRQHGSASPPQALDSKDLVPEEESRSMNTYSELTTVVNPDPAPITATEPKKAPAPAPQPANGQNGVVRVETVLREPKYGIVNSEAEESTLMEEFLPRVEPSLRDDIKLCYIGSGHFALGKARSVIGKYARLTDGSLQQAGHAELKKLTIKTLNNPLPDEPLPAWANQALSECLRLKRFTHSHVLSIMGIGINQQKFHILYPHMQQTILKLVVSDTTKEFSVRQLLNFGQQVAEGLEYLASKDITHKDVAARNCMMDEFSMVKLTDSAFSWDFFEGEYVYDEQRERYLPTRWMAPESLTDGYYDMRTDVWSFAVLVWELLTRGCLPFHEVTDPAEVSDYIVQGYILGKPETLSDEVYDVLRSCWSPENEARPSIANVTSSLSNILDSDGDDTYVNSGSVSYAAQHASGKAATPRQNNGANYYSSTNLSRV